MDDSREMLTLKEVARRFNVSQRTVARLAERGQLKALRVGRQWRFEPEWIEQWVAANTTRSQEDAV